MCLCGTHDTSSARIQELIADVALCRRYDTLSYAGYVTLNTVDFGTAFEDMCEKMLDHVQCPEKYQCVSGNAVSMNYSTW